MSNQVDRMAWSDLLRNFFAPRPKDVDGVANQSSIYYREWCLKKLFGAYEITGSPEEWDIDYTYQHLFLDGYFCITDTDLGVLPLQTGYAGINVFNHPTDCIIANPVLGHLQRKIDVDCVLVKLQYNYQGVSTLIQRYATLLALCDSSIAVNLVNSKVANVFGASSKAQAATMYKMYDDINQGKPAVVINEEIAKKLNDNVVNLRVKESYIADDIEILKKNLMDDFLTEIGIQTANTDKRERLIESEILANRQETKSNAEHWIENVRKEFDKANKMFGLNLGFRLRDFTEGGVKDGNAAESDRTLSDNA